MFERFTRDARMVVKAADTHARGLGSTTIEAEHLLLAIAAREPAMPALAEAGLDHDAVLAALDAERERSLMAVGISVGDFDLPPAPVTRHPRFAASARITLERSLKIAAARSDRRLGTGHILLALLQAEAGTVSRALAVAQVDVDAVRDRAIASLDQQ
jgi:ATP-dependent Clp protease ATP-binding subunit ClpA